ncbi:MAG: hypothetical protein LN590_07410 [Rickettsia endosymbiont of Glossina mortisans submortisans]|nr:hypothetical protein [Rickettsia endosymbiont of Glossina mortisans submortisans]
MLHEERAIELSLAADAPTRIGIDGEKIKDVFFYPERSAVMQLHSSGALFIIPSVGQNKIYMTIIGSNGSMQDIIFKVRDKHPSSIKFLKFNAEWEDKSDKKQIVKSQKHQCSKCTYTKPTKNRRK